MARDFLSDQIRAKNLIGSGSSSNPKLTIYADTDATDNEGGIPGSMLTNVGDDVFLFVSGTIDGKADALSKSVTLFGGDVVISGTLYAENQVIEVDALQTGSLSVSGSINHRDGINIGDAEDGTYTDGLFTDFTSSTLLGTAIDRFNEVLKGLAPSEAPQLQDFSAAGSLSNFSAYLSFGTSNDQASAGYDSVTSIGGFPAVDVNGLYNSASSSNGNHKLGVYSKDATISGVLNEEQSSNVYSNSIVNYPENSFSAAEQGSLKLFLNGVEVHSIDLTDSNVGVGDAGSGTGTELNSNGSGFYELSAVTNGKFASEQEFSTFKHRTGKWKINPADQNNGFNYVQVKHVIGSDERITGYAQWVNDDNADALFASSNTLTLNLGGSKHLSGVEYYRSGSADYSSNISNFYKYIYGQTDVSFTTSSTPSNLLTLTDFSIPTINTATEDHTKVLEISKTGTSLNITTSTRVINGTIDVESNITHPRKSISASATQASANQILIDNVSNSSTNTLENFDDEAYRLISTTYSSQGDASNTNNIWDSTQEIVSGNTGYDDGLLIHNGKLMSTKNAGLPNFGDFSSFTNGPAGNPDYSNGNILSNTKRYIRRFRNTTGNTIRDIRYTINGTGIIRDHSYTLGSSNNNFKLYFKLPGSTAWLDTATAFSYNSVSSDGDGGYIGTFSNDISSTPTNLLTFGTAELSNNEDILVKVESNKTWAGEIDDIEVTFGAVGNVNPSPDTDNIDINDLGVAANLSFGSSLTLAGYTNVGTIGSNTAVDANSLYSTSSTRRGIFNGAVVIDGEINEDVTASGNSYPSNAWGSGQANVGELKLELNGTVISACTIDLTSFGSGDSLNSNNTGFKNVSAATVGEDSSNLPDYRYFWRTGSFQINPADQRDGWNYVRIIHDLDGGVTTHETNYVEWVNDSNSNALGAVLGTSVDYYTSTPSDNTAHLSGVKYWNGSARGFYLTAGNVANVYKYIYSDSSSAINITKNTSNVTITSVTGSGDYINTASAASAQLSLPTLVTTNSNAYDTTLNVSGTFNYATTVCIPDNSSATVPDITINISHPVKTDYSASSGDFARPLIYTLSDTETNLVENFSAESYRMQDVTYSVQADVTNTSNDWDSTVKLNDVSDTAHNTGLMVYNDRLIRPQHDFSYTNPSVPSSWFVYPDTQSTAPDYTSGITGTRTFYRKFQNQTVSSKFNFNVKVRGSGTLISNADSLGTSNNNFRMFIKLPTTSNSQATGYMDFRLAFQTGQVADNDGCRTGGDPDSLTNTLSSSGDGTTFSGTFGTQYAFSDANQNGDYVVLKIEADSSWTGYIDNIELEWS